MIFIPKIIHLTWKNNDIPREWKNVIDSWKKTHPTWDINFMTDNDNKLYIEKNHPDFLQTYNSFPYNIQRADAIRYFLLKDQGGLYSDMDIEPIKNIEPYLEDIRADALLVYSGNVDVFTNSFMLSPLNSPFWDKVIEGMKHPVLPWYAVSKHFIVMYSTGPMLLNRIAKEYTRPIVVLPRNVFMAYNISNHNENKPLAVTKPLKGGSWNGWDSKLLNLGYSVYNNTLPTLIIIIISILFIIFVIKWTRK